MKLHEDTIATNTVGTGHIAGAQGSPPVNAQQQFLYRVMNRIAGVDPTKRIPVSVHSRSEDYESSYRGLSKKDAPHDHMEHAKRMLQAIRSKGIHRV